MDTSPSSPQSTVHSPWKKYGDGLSTIDPQLALLLFCVWVAGCWAPANPERLREEVLKTDPGFTEVLEKRDDLANRIMLIDRELELKRSQVEQKITQLRKDLEGVRQQATQKTEKIKTLLKPDRERLDHALSMATEERRAKRNQRASVGRSISQLRKALKQANPPWTDAERAKMERELDTHLQETQRLDQEIAVLNEHIRLLKVKRILLQL